MIGSNNQYVPPLHLRKEFSQLFIETGEGSSIAVHISAVTVFHVKIHQIYEAKTIIISVKLSNGLFHAILIAGNGHMTADTPSCKYIIDFANTYHGISCHLQKVQNGISRWLHGIVMASGGSLKIREFPNKGAGNNTAYGMFTAHYFPRFLAIFIKLLHGHYILMGGDLQYAVC